MDMSQSRASCRQLQKSLHVLFKASTYHNKKIEMALEGITNISEEVMPHKDLTWVIMFQNKNNTLDSEKHESAPL